jgi:hypothetical protein
MVVYEVNLTIKNEIFDEYYQWLIAHIQLMLQLDGFQEAKIQRPDNLDDKENQKLTICYTVLSKANLDNYFTYHALAMREDGIKRFGNKFSATRRVFDIIDVLYPIT